MPPVLTTLKYSCPTNSWSYLSSQNATSASWHATDYHISLVESSVSCGHIKMYLQFQKYMVNYKLSRKGPCVRLQFTLKKKYVTDHMHIIYLSIDSLHEIQNTSSKLLRVLLPIDSWPLSNWPEQNNLKQFCSWSSRTATTIYDSITDTLSSTERLSVKRTVGHRRHGLVTLVRCYLQHLICRLQNSKTLDTDTAQVSTTFLHHSDF